MVFNSIVSTPDTKFMIIDISNMYMNTPLQEYQYMQFNINIVPQEVIDHYNLQKKGTKDGSLYCERRKAMYGLKESGKLANIKLQTVLASEEYKPCCVTHGLYKYRKQRITSLFLGDKFSVQYIDKKRCRSSHHNTTKKYLIKMNWKGKYYLRMTLEWDYNKVYSKQSVELSMPRYAKEALIEFKHEFVKPQFAVSQYRDPIP